MPCNIREFDFVVKVNVFVRSFVRSSLQGERIMKCLAGCYLVTVERVSIIYFFQVSSKVCKKKVNFFVVKKRVASS